MPILESIYTWLPVRLQQLACSWAGWRIQRTRFGPGFAKHLRAAHERDEWPLERICEYRDWKLHDFINHAATTVPFYRRLFRKHGVDPRRIVRLEDLAQLPLLTKEDVQANCAELISEVSPASPRTVTRTSGTTGSGLQFPTTLSALQQQWAVWWRYLQRHNITRDTLCRYFGGRTVVPVKQSRPPFWRYNWPGHQILFSGYHMSPRNLDAYVDELRRRRPPWLHGYPSLLALLAAHLHGRNEDLGYAVRAITVGAESLLPHQSSLIEQVFGVTPRQHYGMAEAVANISQWPDGSLRVDEDFAAVEFLNAGDGQYQVVGTNFSNPLFPLIRYNVNDLVTLPADAPRNEGGRRVSTIDGRREDYVVVPSGARIGRLDHVFKNSPTFAKRRFGKIRWERFGWPWFAARLIANRTRTIYVANFADASATTWS